MRQGGRCEPSQQGACRANHVRVRGQQACLELGHEGGQSTSSSGCRTVRPRLGRLHESGNTSRSTSSCCCKPRPPLLRPLNLESMGFRSLVGSAREAHRLSFRDKAGSAFHGRVKRALTRAVRVPVLVSRLVRSYRCSSSSTSICSTRTNGPKTCFGLRTKSWPLCTRGSGRGARMGAHSRVSRCRFGQVYRSDQYASRQLTGTLPTTRTRCKHPIQQVRKGTSTTDTGLAVDPRADTRS